MQEELSILIQAQYPLIYLVTSEEERAESAIALIATHKPEKRIFVWTLTRGIIEYGEGSPQHGTIPPQQAFEFAIRHKSQQFSSSRIFIHSCRTELGALRLFGGFGMRSRHSKGQKRPSS